MDGGATTGGLQLWILRHAEARAGSSGGRDRDRPLTADGRAQAAGLGARLTGSGPPLGVEGLRRPEVALVSAATRTVETAGLVCGGLDWVRTEAYVSLYSAGPETVLTYLREVDDDARTALVVGHNPTVSYLAADLVGQSTEDGEAVVGRGLSPCALAVVDLSADRWADVEVGTGRLVGLFGPPY